MTGNELNYLAQASGCGKTAVYKVARLLGRAPLAWEVAYYTKPTTGRRTKYLPTPLMCKEKSIALSVWKGIGDLASNIQLDLEEPGIFKIFVGTIIKDSRVRSQSCPILSKSIYNSIDIWICLYDNILWSTLTESERQQCFKHSQELLLEIVKTLKNIVYGGII